MEANYHNWTYTIPAITLCNDYTNESFIQEFYELSTRRSIDDGPRDYRDYKFYMKIIGSLNAENFLSIDAFKNTTWFKDISGEQLLQIAYNVRSIFLLFQS